MAIVYKESRTNYFWTSHLTANEEFASLLIRKRSFGQLANKHMEHHHSKYVQILATTYNNILFKKMALLMLDSN